MNQTQDLVVREQISALADGRLHGEALVQTLDALCADETLQATWRTYHLVGDVMRTGAQVPCADSAGFVSRFQQRLAAESTQAITASLPVQAETAKPVSSSSVTPLRAPRRAQAEPEAANEPVFRWKLVAGAASLAAAAAIGWNWVGSGVIAPPAGAQMAQQQSQPQLQTQQASSASSADRNSVLAAVQASSPSAAGRSEPTRVLVGSGDPQVMLRDPRLDRLLEAHRQAGGSSQMPSGFLRNATFDGPSR